MDSTFKKLSIQRQEEILDAAAHEFAANGYFNTNILSICKRAKISNGALYKYFHSKEGLYLYTYNYICEKMFTELYDFNPKPDKSIYEVIRDMLRDTHSYFLKHKDYFMMYADIWSISMNGFTPKVSLRLERDIDAYWLGLIEQGLARNEIDPAIDPEYAAFLIDSHTLLCFFSLTSTYHRLRHDMFLGNMAEMDVEKRIARMVENIRFCIEPRNPAQPRAIRPRQGRQQVKKSG